MGNLLDQSSGLSPGCSHLPLHANPKTALLWLHSFQPIYQKLFTHVVREICVYLDESPQQLLCVTFEGISAFRFASETWSPLIRFEDGIPFGPSSTYLQLGNDQILYCGGICILHSANTVHLIRFTTYSCRVQDLPLMHEERRSSGLIFINGWVFVFAGNFHTGESDCYSDSKTGEALDFSNAEEWVKLHGELREKKQNFTPCEYKRKIYLCWKGVLELYDIDSERFRPGPAVQLPRSFATVSWVRQGKMTIISDSYNAVVNLSEETVEVKEEKDHDPISISSMPVVSGNRVFWAGYFDRCMRVKISGRPLEVKRYRRTNNK